MKIKNRQSLTILSFSILGLCFCSCENHQENAQKKVVVNAHASEVATEITAQVYETPVNEPIELPPIYVVEPPEFIENPVIETVIYHDYFDYYDRFDVSDALLMISPTPITNPLAFARSVFDDHSDIAPWLANYIESYGVLPSRVQDKGPFLYSFDVSPDADIFHDDDLNPFHNDIHNDDDDDDDDV